MSKIMIALMTIFASLNVLAVECAVIVKDARGEYTQFAARYTFKPNETAAAFHTIGNSVIVGSFENNQLVVGAMDKTSGQASALSLGDGSYVGLFNNTDNYVAICSKNTVSSTQIKAFVK